MAAKKKSVKKKAAGKKPVARKKKPAAAQEQSLSAVAQQGVKEVAANVALDTGDGGTRRLRIFKAEAEGDTMYVEAVDLDEAKSKFAAIHGELPENLVTWSEVDALPEGEELMAEPGALAMENEGGPAVDLGAQADDPELDDEEITDHDDAYGDPESGKG